MRFGSTDAGLDPRSTWLRRALTTAAFWANLGKEWSWRRSSVRPRIISVLRQSPLRRRHNLTIARLVG
jgi:hypothetical protein